MAPVARIAATIAAILVREGVDYAQSKTVFKAARQRAGLHAPQERRGGVQRLTVDEEHALVAAVSGGSRENTGGRIQRKAHDVSEPIPRQVSGTELSCILL